MNLIYLIFGIVVILLIYGVAVYNNYIVLRTRIAEAFSGIDVQLKRRADLIPNLVETVKGYAKHEKTLFENITKARSALLSAKGPQEKAQANNMISGALKTLFAVAENYPDLKANENFRELQRQLEDTEDKIAYARQFYNSNVLDYNTKIHLFPNSLIANSFGFTEKEFFGVDNEDRKKVDVKFN